MDGKTVSSTNNGIYLAEKSSGGPLTAPGEETTLTIRGLSPKTRYFFRVKCENALGESQFGAEVAVTTLEERRYRDFFIPYFVGNEVRI